MPELAPPNTYASGGLDRQAHRRADAGWIAERLSDPDSLLVPVWRSLSLLGPGPEVGAALLPARAELVAAATTVAFLGLGQGRAHFALDLSAREEPGALIGADHSFVDLRSVGAVLAHGEGALLAYARGLMHWHARHGFCAVCGQPAVSEAAGHARRCLGPACGAQHFPRTDPAVIMLVTDGARVVLGRQKNWPAGLHSVLAGFVEPGESLEDTVRREVMEEIGVPVGDVRYRSSQPWPFPASLMVAFTARAEARELRLDTDELEAARWYDRDALRRSPEDEHFRLPRRDSISRRLIEDWLAGD